jgi:hypothetical protein
MLLLADGEARALADRKKRLMDAIPRVEDDFISGETSAVWTSGRPACGDGMHLLVMDLHKELNRLHEMVAEERIDSAGASGLAADDRPPGRGLHEGFEPHRAAQI